MSDLMRRISSLMIAVLLLGAPLGPPVARAEADLSGLAAQSLAGHIRPGYGAFFERTQALETAVEAHCALREGSAEGLIAAFREAVLAWARVEHLRFGPAVRENRYERIAFWPDAKGLARRQVLRAIDSGDEGLLTRGVLAGRSAALQGLTALEVVLFADDKVAGLEPTLVSPGGAFRCQLAVAIADNLTMLAEAITRDWAEGGDYAAIWLSAGADNPVYLEPSEIALELSRAYEYGLFTLRENKLVAPLGLMRPRRRPTLPAYFISELSVPVIAANTEGILGLLRDGGLLGVLEAHSPSLASGVVGELERVIALAGEVEATGRAAFTSARETDRKKLISMGFPLKTALVSGGAGIKSAAGLQIGFNAADGD